MRQFVVNLKRPVLDLDRAALTLLYEAGAVIPVDSQLASHIEHAQG
jgi:hypothetical protein